MLSPRSAPPNQPNDANGHHPTYQSAGSEEGQHNSAWKDESVVNGGAEPAHSLTAVPRNTIDEGKEKAKAVMAASNLLAIQPASDQDPLGERASSDDVRDSTVNGSHPSRKRSRSGTRIPQHPRSTESGKAAVPVRTRAMRDRVYMEELVHREMLGIANVKDVDAAQLALAKAKFEERDYYTKAFHDRRKNAAAIFGPGYARYANVITDPSKGSIVICPAQRRRPGGKKTKELLISKKDRATQAEELDVLSPIRLDIEWGKIRLRDTFTWNINDRVITPELFAEQLVEDLNLPREQCGPLVQLVAASIHEQIADYHPHIHDEEEALDPNLPYHAHKDDEMRIIIKLNITIGQQTLMDQFEWDINNKRNSPEDFARQMTSDLSLSGEFTTAIAHSIREQSQLFTRSLYVVSHPFDGRPIEDPELKAAFLPSPLPSTFRTFQAAKDFTPYLYEMNEAELEKTELSLSREERRQKRSVNRRGGPTLPDLKDRRHTIRTLVVSSVLPGAAESLEESRIFKRTATTSGKPRRPGLGQRDGADDSDESESEDSSPESAAIPSHLLSGTARTRNMRTAASAAQAAMRGTIGRSATPEVSALHHHETRTFGRRPGGGREYREESSVEPSSSLILKFRVPRQRFQQLLRNQRAKSKDELPQPTTPLARPATGRSPSSGTLGTAAPGNMGPPTTTPRLQQRSLPAQDNGSSNPPPASEPNATHQPVPPSQLGRVEAPSPPVDPSFPIVRRDFSFFEFVIFSSGCIHCRKQISPFPPFFQSLASRTWCDFCHYFVA